MVTLILDDYLRLEPISELEQLLIDKNIQFQIGFDVSVYGWSKPYLIVDGVPLDNVRSIKWVKEQGNE